METDKLLLILLIILMLIPRAYIAPYTSGSDIPQFAGFADTFLRHGLCFYRYADTTHAVKENWPYPWPYVYGPGLILFLAPLRIIAPTPIQHFWKDNSYHVYVPMDWLVASKSLFILFDILSGIMLYILIRRIGYTPVKAFILALLYGLNPMTIYISAIYGMFDQIPLFFMLLGIYMIYFKRKLLYNIAGSLSAGLTIAIKHTFLYPLTILFLDLLPSRRNFRRKSILLLFLILGAIALFIPFEAACPGSINSFIRIIMSTSKPGYTPPLCYSFNGLSSLATYINEHTGKNTLFLIQYWWVPSVTLLVLTILSYLVRKDPIIYSSTAYIVFTTTYWRVNHQYLVPAIAFSIILYAYTKECIRCRIISLVYVFLASFWPIMFPTSWWAHVHIAEPNKAVWELLDKLSLMVFDEEYYLLYSLLLTITGYLYVLEYIIYGLHGFSAKELLEKSKTYIYRLLRKII